jgi:SAM-dependent methyltransferase
MDDRVFRRVQRYGWDLATETYADGWVPRLRAASLACLDRAGINPGESVVDLACGPGVVSLPAARRVGAHGRLMGIDISERMVAAAKAEAAEGGLTQASFARRDMEDIGLPDDSVDVVVCAFGLMYAANRAAALAEIRRVLRPGGRLVACAWGRRDACGFAEVFPIVDRRVASEVCPTFFALGVRGAFEAALAVAGLTEAREERAPLTLSWPDGASACAHMFAGGPVALAWSRLPPEVRAEVEREYLASIAPFGRPDGGYDVPCEVVYGSARKLAV